MNAKVCSGFERLARTAEFREINPFDSTQLKEFPLRVSFEKRGLLFTPKIKYKDFDKLSRQYLDTVSDMTNGEARYALVLNKRFPEMPDGRIFTFDCKTHREVVPSEMLSLDDLTDDMFEKADEVEVDVRTPNGNSTCLDYFRKPKNMLFVYGQGDLNFKESLAQGILRANLPSGFRFGKTGYEFM